MFGTGEAGRAAMGVWDVDRPSKREPSGEFSKKGGYIPPVAM